MSKRAKILVMPVKLHSAAAGATLDAETSRRRAGLFLVVLFGAVVIYGAATYIWTSRDQISIDELSPQSRASVVRRTEEELATFCREPAAATGGVRDHCIAQARFIIQFPECSASCQRGANLILPHVRR